MSEIYEKVVKCLEIVRAKTDFVPKVALVLGSGLGGFADEIDVKAKIDYSEIDGFPVSTVPGHHGQFVFGYINSVPVVVMKGRVHYYEGYPISDVVLPIRLMRMMGAEVLFLTNAVGGVNRNFGVGEFMLIRDQILFNVPSPLIGENIEEFGTRFPDMSEIYCNELQSKIRDSALEMKVRLNEGVYLQVSGPNFESPAEIRAFGVMGADVVGMSTACEAIAANHMGMKVCGVSCISNLAAGISQTPLTHDEVQEAADIAAPQFKLLLTEAITRMGK